MNTYTITFLDGTMPVTVKAARIDIETSSRWLLFVDRTNGVVHTVAADAVRSIDVERTDTKHCCACSKAA